MSQDNAKSVVGPARLADRITDTLSPGARQAFTAWTAVKIAIIGALIVVMNRQQFPILYRTWLRDPNWSHGFLIPLFSIYLIYVRFGEIMAARRQVCLWGLIAVIAAGALQVFPYRIQNPWSAQIAMVLLATALVLHLAGWQVFKFLWLPILFLVFAMPVSQAIYTDVAFRLQNVAAYWATKVLELCTVQVQTRGSTLFVVNLQGREVPLTVEEACSGVRLLMAFVALSVAMAYMAERPIWQRVVLVLMGIPVAIACNVLRVVITATMFIIGREEFGKHFMHSFTGMMMLIPAVGMLWLVGWVLQRLFVEEDVEDDQDDQPAPETAHAGDDMPGASDNSSASGEANRGGGTRGLIELLRTAITRVSGFFDPFRKKQRLHFALALVILLAVGTTIQAYGWIVKKPIRWPEVVEVNYLHRNTSMPDALPDESGPYVAITEGDPLYGKVKDYQEGADLIIREDSLGVLGMRTIHDDEQRLAERRANWYGIRRYRDTRADVYSPFLYWQLEVFYYTGLRDQVPHVPNICLDASGAVIDKQDHVVFHAPNAREPWNQELKFQRVLYSTRQPGGSESQGVTYYLLGFNDEPINRESATRARLDVREKMASWDAYNYFVKIQFSPLRLPTSGIIGVQQLDADQANAAAQEFVESFMPKILEQLPTRETIAELERAEEASDD